MSKLKKSSSPETKASLDIIKESALELIAAEADNLGTLLVDHALNKLDQADQIDDVGAIVTSIGRLMNDLSNGEFRASYQGLATFKHQELPNQYRNRTADQLDYKLDVQYRTDYSSLAEAVTDFRAQTGLGMQEYARLVGVSNRTVAQLEHNKGFAQTPTQKQLTSWDHIREKVAIRHNVGDKGFRDYVRTLPFFDSHDNSAWKFQFDGIPDGVLLLSRILAHSEDYRAGSLRSIKKITETINNLHGASYESKDIARVFDNKHTVRYAQVREKFL